MKNIPYMGDIYQYQMGDYFIIGNIDSRGVEHWWLDGTGNEYFYRLDDQFDVLITTMFREDQ